MTTAAVTVEEEAGRLVAVWLRDPENSVPLARRIAVILKHEQALWERVAERYVQAQARAAQLAAALRGLKRGRSCWCEVAIGNPNYRGQHTAECLAARAALNDEEEKENP